jgi:hypothetical protein
MTKVPRGSGFRHSVGALCALASASVMGNYSTASAAQVVVLEARGTPFKVGQTIDGLIPVKLEAGQKLTVITEDGKTIPHKGPWEGAPAPETTGTQTTVVQALLDLGRQNDANSAALGVVRAGGADRVPADPSYMDITRPGHRCVQEGIAPVFWWPDRNGGDVRVVIEPTDHSWTADADWPASAGELMTLNSAALLRDGRSYLVGIENGAIAISVHVVPAGLPNETVRAIWMGKKGCHGQAQAIAKKVASSK